MLLQKGGAIGGEGPPTLYTSADRDRLRPATASDSGRKSLLSVRKGSFTFFASRFSSFSHSD